MGCEVGDVALTTSTSEGIGAVMAGMDLGPGDEIVSSDQEHPGLLGPLKAARDRGADVRLVPFPQLADAVRATTTLVACSHVGWVSGEVAPAELADVGVPVILDGAQGAGAVPVDVTALGCGAYAAAGQKWLCGADGTGMLYVAPALRPARAVGRAQLRLLRRRLEGPRLAAEGRRAPLRHAVAVTRGNSRSAWRALRVIEAHGLDAVHARGRALAAELAERLAAAGRTVAPRGDTTLVAWEDDDPEATRDRLAESGVRVRNLPGRPLLRASVGAWNDESDLERLLAAL